MPFMKKLLQFLVSLWKQRKWNLPLSIFFQVSLFVFFMLGASELFAQTFPAASSCVSKDLLLVKASVPTTPCETCSGNVTKPLTVAINNKTGSTRTSFAFWATLKILNPDGSVYGSPQNISGCYGPVP